jgi:DNA-binding GntR family transcriptional regulator
MATKPLLKRQTVSEQVADYISAKIMRGELSGGQQIRQEAIAEELGVSRIPVREALLVLEASGLIVNRPHRGAVVAELSVEDAHDVFDSRLLIEPYLVARAAERRSDTDVKAAQRAMDEYERAIEGSSAESELNALNWALHLSLMRPSGMTRLLTFVDTLLNSADRYLRLQIRPEDARRAAIIDHRNIVEAFTLKLPERCQELTYNHIESAREEIILCLARRQAGSSE